MKSLAQTTCSVLATLLVAANLLLPSLAQDAVEPAPPAEVASDPAPAPEAAADDLAAEVRDAIAALSSESFREREAATIRLWNIGDKAQPFIEEAAKTGDFEVRLRAKRMLDLFRFGIYPDTPPAAIELINQFRYGDLEEKTNAIQQLFSLDQMATATKLIRSIEDQAVRTKLVSSVIDELDEKLAAKFAEEKYDDVESLLQLAAGSNEGQRNLAAFYLHLGSLDAEIARLRAQEVEQGKLTAVEHEQLSWSYRVKGDLAAALASATAAGNAELERDVRIAQGDLLTLIKASHNPNDRTIQTYGFRAAAQRLGGDSDGFEATIKTIKEYAAENPGEESQCLEALLINGRIADAIEIAPVGGTDRLQLLIDNGEHARALAELGIDDPKPPYDDWLDTILKNFSAASSQSEYATALFKPYTVARLLKGWGEGAEAERIFDKLGQVASEQNPEFMPRFIANASVLNLHAVALKYTRTALAKEAADAKEGIDAPPIDLAAQRIRNRVGQRDAEESLISGLYYNSASTAVFLWNDFENRFPDETGGQRLDRIENLLAPVEPGPDAAARRAAALETIAGLVPKKDAEMDVEERVTLLSNLAEIYLRHEDRPAAMELIRQSLLLERDDATYANITYGEMLAEDGRWEEAAEHFKIGAAGSAANPALLVLQAVALERCGKADEAAPLLKRARLQALGRPDQFMRIASAFSEFHEYDRAREASQLALDIASLDDPVARSEALRLADFLIFRDDARAAMYKERYLIECLKTHVNLTRVTGASSIRASIGTIQARLAIAEERTAEAIDITRDLIERQPSNSSIIEDLYPVLVAAGCQKEADEFYEKLNQYGEDALAIFPDSAQDLNSNAWLKARCGKDLDTALERSKRSNELSPDNYAYIDTLAEVYFQRGERSKAVELSEKAVKLSSNDFLLYHQLQRFTNDQPLKDRPAR